MTESNLVPLMYQAQIECRGKIQYVGNQTGEQPASQWLNQWLKGCPPIPKLDENIPIWRQQRPQTQVKMPEFGSNVHTWEYTQSWRFVTNSGQDEGIIRPVIGPKGIPYYPGTSMKGAFLRACQQIAPDKVLDYCGGEVEEIIAERIQKRTKPGILRFHGGYPVDMSWGNTKRLLDVVHNQQERQVMVNENSSAKVQISLYKTKFKFGISCTQNNSNINVDWDLVEKIWEQALSQGLGSRTSAGYGRFTKCQGQTPVLLSNPQVIASVDIRGQGIISTLLNKTPEFRPNMFKAALRGHTLRLLAGVTDQQTTQRITRQLWGGFVEREQENGSVVGKFGIDFQIKDIQHKKHQYYRNNNQISMDLYDLKSGKLNIISFQPYSEGEKEFLSLLIKFSLLLGGLGKSWRRVDHRLFYPSYFINHDKPMIGSHWSFTNLSESANYCITAPRGELNNIRDFLSSINRTVINCFELPSTNTYVDNWREVWHPQKVQIWGRIAENKNDSQAVEWFHRNDFIKRTELTGRIGNQHNPSQVSRIWHRMYPLYVKKDGKIRHQNKYVELLTIFPIDNLTVSQEFLNYLGSDSNDFEKIWGD